MSKTINHIAILVDRSSSTQGIAPDIIRQFNAQAEFINERSKAADQSTHLSLYTFSTEADHPLLFEVPLDLVALRPLTNSAYRIDGWTAMLDSIGLAITDLSRFHESSNLAAENHSFLIIVLTDGEENKSRKFNARSLQQLMDSKVRTDAWTFAFLVPKGGKRTLMQEFSIPEGNISEWGQTAAGVVEASRNTQAGLEHYFTARSKGQRATRSFFQTNLATVSAKVVSQNLEEVTGTYTKVLITRGAPTSIREFCEHQIGEYRLGHAYYELTKPETIQPQKQIIVENKISGKQFSGQSARDLLKIPLGGGNIRVKPGDHGVFNIYVQSTSVNRKLIPGTSLLYAVVQTAKVKRARR